MSTVAVAEMRHVFDDEGEAYERRLGKVDEGCFNFGSPGSQIGRARRLMILFGQQSPTVNTIRTWMNCPVGFALA